MKRKNIVKSIVVFSIAFILVLGSSFYCNYSLNPSEFHHFWVPFPTEVGKPVKIVYQGGESVRVVKPIIINVNQQGILKRIFNPWIIGLSTHWIINAGNQSYVVQLELVNCTIPVEWEVHAGVPYDTKTRTFTRPLAPGEGIPDLGVDWFFHIPREVRAHSVWYQGGLKVVNAETGRTLTFIPIKIVGGWGVGWF